MIRNRIKFNSKVARLTDIPALAMQERELFSAFIFRFEWTLPTIEPDTKCSNCLRTGGVEAKYGIGETYAVGYRCYRCGMFVFIESDNRPKGAPDGLQNVRAKPVVDQHLPDLPAPI